METMNKDLAQVTKVETVSSDNNFFAEVGGSVVRFPVSNLLKRVADDSSGAAEALETLSEAIENNPDVVEAILTPISKNSETTEKFETEHEQFTIASMYITSGEGQERKGDSPFHTTEFIPINKKYPIVTTIQGTENTAALALYDANKNILGTATRFSGQNQIDGVIVDGYTVTLPADKIPANAVYFRSCTNMTWGQVPNPSYSNGPTCESREGAVADAIKESKKLPLIDEWNEEFGSQGGYQPKTDKYRLLDTDFNSEEAMRIMSHRGLQLGDGLCNHYGAKSLPATIIASEGIVSYGHCFYKSPLLEIIPAFKSYNYITSSNLDAMFDGCERLRIIKPIFYLPNTKTANRCFARCYALEEVHLQHLKISISFADCPNISLASLNEAVTNATNTETITITVHADVYAKLTDTSNTEWNAVLTAAAAKQISFATA